MGTCRRLGPPPDAVLTLGCVPPGPSAPCPGGAQQYRGEPAAPHRPGGLPQPAPGESLPPRAGPGVLWRVGGGAGSQLEGVAGGGAQLEGAAGGGAQLEGRLGQGWLLRGIGTCHWTGDPAQPRVQLGGRAVMAAVSWPVPAYPTHSDFPSLSWSLGLVSVPPGLRIMCRPSQASAMMASKASSTWPSSPSSPPSCSAPLSAASHTPGRRGEGSERS